MSALAADVAEDALRTSRDARQIARDLRALSRAALVEATPKVNVSVGIARDEDEGDTRSISTPYSLSYQTVGDSWWKFQVQGDGYTRVASPGSETLTGLSDIRINVLHPLTKGVIGSAGVGIPTHGAVGSTEWSERGKLIFLGDFSTRFSYVAIGSVSHTRRQTAGISNWSQAIYGEMDYALSSEQTLLVGLSRSHTAGAGGSTDLAIEYDFPIQSAISGAFALTRGLTAGLRHTGIEFDLNFSF